MLERIKGHFYPEYIKIYDNTIYHKIKNNKKHLTIIIVSNKFKNQKILKRHQEIYKILSREINNTIHAISMHTYTPEEWKKKKYFKFIKCKNKK
ncbi:BolA/IbaG family iron-sulfur metabolism protein [Buchnera aphidicola]|uniref:BolA/IbaG family iron-sulfur metabolism protein n=1 Tax=Buchnera aphidicola TaxID=9 RepID=UPI0034647A92